MRQVQVWTMMKRHEHKDELKSETMQHKEWRS